jgi:hypothetical protein
VVRRRVSLFIPCSIDSFFVPLLNSDYARPLLAVFW